MSSFRTRIWKNEMWPDWESSGEGSLTFNETGIIWTSPNYKFALEYGFIKGFRAVQGSKFLTIYLGNYGKSCVVFMFVNPVDFFLLGPNHVNNIGTSNSKKKKKRKRKRKLLPEQIENFEKTKKQKTTAALSVFSAHKWVNYRTEDIWREICQSFLNVADFAIIRRTNKSINNWWGIFIRKYVKDPTVRVPRSIPTLSKALAFVNAYHENYANVEIDLEAGTHKIACSVLNVTRSNITFIGKGKDQTTILGGFQVLNQQNVKFEDMTITNPKGSGLNLKGSETNNVSETNVDVSNCIVKECGRIGMYVGDHSNVRATQCEFMENGGSGVYCTGIDTKATLINCKLHHNQTHGLYSTSDVIVNIEGTETDIYSNKRYGIVSNYRAEVNIFVPLPTQPLHRHKTSHDNVEGNLHQQSISEFNIDAFGQIQYIPIHN